MNEILELSRSLATAGQVYLFIVGTVALGLLVFDRHRKRRAPELTIVAGLRPGESAHIRDDEDGSEVEPAAKRA